MTTVELELWKHIRGYDYEISNFGRVRGQTLELLEPFYDKPGEHRKWGSYPRVQIPYQGTVHYHLVHRLVAKYHLPVDDVTRTYVDHKDRNRLNSHHDNLRWVTPRENSRNLTKRVNNTSGKQGVCRLIRKTKNSELCYWVATINDDNGKRKRKNFSIKTLGEEEAKRLAIEYRKQMELEFGYIGD